MALAFFEQYKANIRKRERERRQVLRDAVAPLKTLEEHEAEAEEQRLIREYAAFVSDPTHRLTSIEGPSLVSSLYCQECDRTFGTKAALTQHTKHKHKGS